MSLITLGVGQAGCQGAAALFELLGQEAALPPGGASGGGASGAASASWTPTADRFFHLAAPAKGRQPCPTARAILVDTEPSTVAAAHAAAAATGSWQFSRAAAQALKGGSTAGNWAAGALQHGPSARASVIGMVRRQAERCDALGGLLIMQSLAGGSSGLGSALVEALRDEYSGSRLLSHCIWPLESGEVATQAYNTLLGLTSLAEHSSGVILTYNDSLLATCQQALGIQRPAFRDLNALAARHLAAALLPCSQRQAPSIGGAGSSSSGSGKGRGLLRPAWDAAPAAPAPVAAPAPAAGAWDGSFGSGSRWGDEAPAGGSSLGGSSSGGGFDALVDACDRLCSRPSYRLLTLRSSPQRPAGSFAFTPFSWPTVLKGLRHLQSAGAAVDGLNGSGGSGPRGGNRALASLLLLRGDGAAAADVANSFGDAALFSSGAQRHAAPLAVAASGARLGGQQMLAALLSNDQGTIRCTCMQTPVAPLGRMLERAQRLHGARAYVQQYSRYGLSCGELGEALAAAQGLLDSYRSL